MALIDRLIGDGNLWHEELVALNGMMDDMLHFGVSALISRSRLSSADEESLVEALSSEICDFVIHHRGEIPIEMDLLGEDPIF
ncbi:MAG TPA: hypothetical protein PLS83_13265 [Methanothrix soehngenii]|nr:hypothetical protein [Methanothrix soehngenii]